MVKSSFLRFLTATLFVVGMVFGMSSCNNDDVDARRDTQSFDKPDGERIENKVVKGTLTHDWDQVLTDEKTQDLMDALLTVTTYVNGEIEGEPQKFGRHPRLDGSIYLEKENYQITAEQVENHILTQELRRHYVLNAQTGLWEELDTLVAKTQDNTVFVPVKVTTETIEIAGKVVPFPSDSVTNIRLVSVENVQASTTRAAGETYIKAVHPTLYKAMISVIEKNVTADPETFEVPVQIMTNRYEIDIDDVDEWKVINQDQYWLTETTSEVVADVILTMKSGEVVNEHLSYTVNHKFEKLYGGKHYVAHFGYNELAINPKYTAGTLAKVKTDGNWDIMAQTDKYRTDDSNGVDEDLVTMNTNLYMEVATYHHPVAGDIVWELKKPVVSQTSTGITSVASDEEGWQKAEIMDVIGINYLGHAHALDAKADLYTKQKSRKSFDLEDGKLWVEGTHIKGEINFVENFTDGSQTTTTDKIDVEWTAVPATDWLAYEKNATQSTSAAALKETAKVAKANGFWNFEQLNYDATSEATLNASKQANKVLIAIANNFTYTREGKKWTFDKLEFSVSNENGAYVTLSGQEDGKDTYKYGDKFNVTLGGSTVVAETPGKIVISETSITGREARNKKLTIGNDDVTASFTDVLKFSDNTEKETAKSKTYPRSRVLLTNWSSHETSAAEATAQPTIKLEGSETVKSEDGWSCVNQTRFLNAVTTLAGSTQNNSWRCIDPNNIKFEEDGFVVDFGTIDFSVSLINHSATLKETTATLDTYDFAGTIAITYGDNTVNSTAPGQILVDKDKKVTDHEIRNAKLTITKDNVSAKLDFVTLFNNGTEESVADNIDIPRNLICLSNWLANSAVFPFTTGAATVSLTSSVDKSNGYWTYVLQTRRIKTVAQPDANTTKDNEWESVDANKLVYTREGKSYAFDIIDFSAAYVDAKTSLTEETATSMSYDYTCEISVTYGDHTQNTTAPGKIVLTKERTVTGHEILNPYIEVVDDKVNVTLTWVTKFSDNTTSEESVSEFFDRNILYLGPWASYEKNGNQQTGAASVNLDNTEAKTKGYFSYNQEKRTIKTIASLDASSQDNLWESFDPNHIVYSRDGVSHDFGILTFGATSNDSGTSVSSDTDEATIYGYWNNISVTYGSNTKNAQQATGTITVKKEKPQEPEKELKWGKIKGTAATVSLTENCKDWLYTLVARTEKGVIKFIVPKNAADITLDESMFEYNTDSNVNSAAYYNGAWRACEAKDASTAMKWRASDGSITYTMISYSDATIMGFHNGHNTVFTGDYTLSAENNGSVLVITRASDGKTWRFDMPTV